MVELDPSSELESSACPVLLPVPPLSVVGAGAPSSAEALVVGEASAPGPDELDSAASGVSLPHAHRREAAAAARSHRWGGVMLASVRRVVVRGEAPIRVAFAPR